MRRLNADDFAPSKLGESNLMRHTYYFTFGVNHPFTGHYVAVEASSSNGARILMDHYFGSRWSSQYDDISLVHENDRKKGKLGGCTINAKQLDPDNNEI